jgi:hypothetical protein
MAQVEITSRRPLGRAKARRDENPGIKRSKIPAETPYLASHRKRAVRKGWLGSVLRLNIGKISYLFRPRIRSLT